MNTLYVYNLSTAKYTPAIVSGQSVSRNYFPIQIITYGHEPMIDSCEPRKHVYPKHPKPIRPNGAKLAFPKKICIDLIHADGDEQTDVLEELCL